MTDIHGVPIVGSGVAAPMPDVVGGIPPFNVESEEALALRFGRLKKQHEDLIFEFTRDPALILQYCRIYESECRMVNSKEFRAKESAYNRRSHLLIVRRGNMCVGGARLTVKTPRLPSPLPMEISGFKLEDYFPELKQPGVSYGEWSRVVVLPEFRSGDVSGQMLFHLYRKTVAIGLSYSFGTAPKINLRAYRQQLKSYGVDVKLHYDIVIPPYPSFEEVKDYLVSLTVEKSPEWGKEGFIQDSSNASLAEQV